MARINGTQAHNEKSRTSPSARKATVVHDGSAFELAADLRRFGFEVAEGSLSSSAVRHGDSESLAVIATRAGTATNERLRECARELCWKGAAVLAVGAAVGPVAELFGSIREEMEANRAAPRLADVRSDRRGLFAGLPTEFRLALSPGDRFETDELSAEFSKTAWSRDGELIGASHVFRPVHLLHPAVLETGETRPIVLGNLLRLLRERGGRAF